MKFIHAADIHLDSPLKGLELYEGAPVDEIRGATRRALVRLVDLAIDEEVDFLLIAGDLYDGNWKDYNTGLFFIKEMVRLLEADIPVFVIAGNHDAANKMTRSLRLPTNVTPLSTETPETVLLDDLGVAIHGRGFAKEAETANLAKAYPVGDSGLFNIGLLHTSLDGRPGHANYAPCSVDDLRSRNYQYWALGHIHTRDDAAMTDPHIVFPGNLQGRHARETGEKGCVLVKVDARNNIDVKFRSVDVLRWEHGRIDCAPAQTLDDVLNLCERQFSQILESHEALPLAVRLTLEGATTAHQEMMRSPEDWTAQLRGVANTVGADRLWLEKVNLRTAPAREMDDLISAEGPLGELARQLRELPGNEAAMQGLIDELAPLQKRLAPLLKMAHELVDTEDRFALDDPAYLRQLLDEVQPLLLDKLLAEEAAR